MGYISYVSFEDFLFVQYALYPLILYRCIIFYSHAILFIYKIVAHETTESLTILTSICCLAETNIYPSTLRPSWNKCVRTFIEEIYILSDYQTIFQLTTEYYIDTLFALFRNLLFSLKIVFLLK